MATSSLQSIGASLRLAEAVVHGDNAFLAGQVPDGVPEAGIKGDPRSPATVSVVA